MTTLYQHDTDVAERWDDLVEAIQATHKHAINGRDNMRMLRQAGKDCLTLVVEKCHEAGLEFFWSHRINDIHDSFETDWLFSNWKNDDFFSGDLEEIDLGMITQKEALTFYNDSTLVIADENFKGIGGNIYSLDLK